MSAGEKLFGAIGDNILSGVHTAIIAQVVSTQLEKGECTLQPIVNRIDSSGNAVQYPQIQHASVSKIRLYHRVPSALTPNTTAIATSYEDEHVHKFDLFTEETKTEEKQLRYMDGVTEPHDHVLTTIEDLETKPDESQAHRHTISYAMKEELHYLWIKPGDIVLAICCEHSIDSIHAMTVHTPQSNRRFDLTDAVVVSIISEAL